MKLVRRSLWNRAIIFILIFDLFFGPAVPAVAERITGIYRTGTVSRNLPPVASDALPVINSFNASIDDVHLNETAVNQLDIIQTSDGAVLLWDSFNIGTDAKVVFDQGGNANWTALNRIYDQNPSQIFGQMSADGKIFLINQNGFYFGPSARIGNLHTLAVSALNIAETELNQDFWHFTSDNYQADPAYAADQAFIENHGEIQVQNGGAVYLMAPEVENSGTINAPTGHAALIAGEAVTLYDKTNDATRPQKSVRVPVNPGVATNRGTVRADQGVAGMYAGVVNQDGLVTSVTAVYQNGKVELLASDEIRTYENSYTGTPLSQSGDTADRSFTTDDSIVTVALGPLDVLAVDDPELVLKDYPQLIQHMGQISSPSGSVKLDAETRIYLGPSSSIDVSGAEAYRSASDNQIELQLNSVEMSDEFLARLGALKGETIKVNALVGTDIGHISGHLNKGQKTVQESSVAGGKIRLDTSHGSGNGDVIVDRGAVIDISGGVTHYSAGSVETSKVRLGDEVYDIGNIPDNVLEMADRLTLLSNKEAARYGATYIPAYGEGADAGTLTIETGTAVLNGRLNGTVTRGRYQTAAAEPTIQIGDSTYQTARGLREPQAGTLIIGYNGTTNGTITDRVLDRVVIQRQINPLPAQFNILDPLSDTTTYISSDMINQAGLGNLTIAANRTIEIKNDADLKLAASQQQGEVELIARRIDHSGSITIPGGSIKFYNDVNTVTSLSGTTEEGIWLHSGSVLNVAGENIDRWNDPAGLPDQLHLDGGDILLSGRPKTEFASVAASSHSTGVFIEQGASVNVDGGYAVDYSGGVQGGDAGTLEVAGRSIALDGHISGLARIGNTGGTLKLKAQEIQIVDSPAALPGNGIIGLAMTDDRLDQTGFSRLEFYSDGDLTVSDNANLSPSRAKYTASMGRLQQRQIVTQAPAQYTEPSHMVFEARAGNFTENAASNIYNQAVTIGRNANLAVTNGGSISIKGGRIDIQGRLTARGGDVTAEVTPSLGADLIVHNGAVIDASGYTQADLSTLAIGLPLEQNVYAGGTVALNSSSTNGVVRIEEGATIDVSGSPRVQNYYRTALGRIRSYNLAAEAGSIEIGGYHLDLRGRLLANTHMSNLAGGSLSITSKDISGYELNEEDLQRYREGGFDDWKFSSRSEITFADDIDIRQDTAGGWYLRNLTLDAPEISLADGCITTIEATNIYLQNSNDKFPDNQAVWSIDPVEAAADPNQAETLLDLVAGEWMGINGSIAFSNMHQLSLAAGKDMVLSDEFYTKSNPSAWGGELATYADTTLTAGRIYPTTDTEFTIRTGIERSDGTWRGGGLTILQSEGPSIDGPILSANGQVTISSNDFEHYGTLLAPMGRIYIEGGGNGSKVLLADGSTLSTASDAAVQWGYYQNEQWQRTDKDNLVVQVDGDPVRAIDIIADEVISDPNSLIDLTGGGIVYATEFLPSIAGSADPLSPDSGRYVILPNNSVQLPGAAVYLAGGDGIAAGVYSLLPAEYAFIPGAMVIEVTDKVYDTDAGYGESMSGYTRMVGRWAEMGTSVRSPQALLFTVRSAEDVLNEGAFQGSYAVAGSGGSLFINSETGRLTGVYSGAGLNGYQGGTAQIGSRHMVLTTAAGNQNSGVLYFDPSNLFGAGFDTVAFGHTSQLDQFGGQIGPLAAFFDLLDDRSDREQRSQSTETETLIVAADILDEDSNRRTALGLYGQSLEVSDGTDIKVDELILAAPDGVAQLGATAQVEADTLGIFARTMDVTDNVVFGQTIAVAGTGTTHLLDNSHVGGTTPVDGSVRISAGVWNRFNSADHLALAANSNLHFDGLISTGARALTYLNAPRFTGSEVNGTQRAHIGSAILWVDNSGAAATSVDSNPSGGSITFEAGGNRVLEGMESGYDADRLFSALSEDGMDVSHLKNLLADTGPEASTSTLLLTGEVHIDDFSSVEMISDQEMVMAGEGGFYTDGGLTLTARKLTAGYRRNGDDEYSVADFTMSARGAMTILQGAGQAIAGERTPGGILRFEANTLDHHGTIDNFAGGVVLSATQAVHLHNNSQILADGGIETYDIAGDTVYQAYQSGWVSIESEGAVVDMDSGALIDVSNLDGTEPQPGNLDQETWNEWIADGKLDAGTIQIKAANADLIDANGLNLLAGTLSGASSYGRGGRFNLDARTFDYNQVAARLGDFSRQVQLHSRQGDMHVNTNLTAEQIKLVADGTGVAGAATINVAANLDASGSSNDRRIELYAQGDVNLNSGQLLVTGTGTADGGEVIVKSGTGWINQSSGSTIDVSGGQGGRITFIADRFVTGDATSSSNDPSVNDLKLQLAGTIRGASRIRAAAAIDQQAAAINSAVISSVSSANTGFISRAIANSVAVDGVEGRLVDNLTIQTANQDGTWTTLDRSQRLDVMQLIPYVELYGQSLTLAANSSWDLSGSAWRYGQDNTPGILVLRAGQNLTVNGNITDRPHSNSEMTGNTNREDTWDITLVAGADLGSADTLATIAGQGDLTIANGALVFTESGDIHFAAGGDVNIGQGGLQYYDDGMTYLTSYNLATHDGDIVGKAGGDLNIAGARSTSATNAGAIQSAMGNIILDVQGDLNLGRYSAIRTTGITTAQLTEPAVAQHPYLFWLASTPYSFSDQSTGQTITTTYYHAIYTYQQHEQDAVLAYYKSQMDGLTLGQFESYDHGGSIDVSVGGDVSGQVAQYGMYRYYGTYSENIRDPDPALGGASFVYATDGSNDRFVPAAGIVAMAGNSVAIDVKGDFGTAASPIQAAAFGQGDLLIRAGGDVDGRFLIEDGRFSLTTLQSYSANSNWAVDVIDSPIGAPTTLDLMAQGDLKLGAVIDPLMAMQWSNIDTRVGYNNINNFQWTEDTALKLSAMKGDLTMLGNANTGFTTSSSFWMPQTMSEADVMTALPATVSMIAGGDVVLADTPGSEPFWLLPSATGNLTIVADGDIRGEGADTSGRREYAELRLDYKAPEAYYDYLQPEGGHTGNLDGPLGTWLYDLHANDFQPLVLKAGGSISNLWLTSMKSAQITAGGDILDNYFEITNLHRSDTTVIAAEGKVGFSVLPAVVDQSSGQFVYSGIKMGGPGELIVAAGDYVDLGFSAGLRTDGNVSNPTLPNTGSSITVASGYEFDTLLMDSSGQWDAGTADLFFDALLDAGINHTALKYGEVVVGDETIKTDINWARGLGSAYAEQLAGYAGYADVPQSLRELLAESYLAATRTNLMGAYLNPTSQSGSQNGVVTDPFYLLGKVQGVDFTGDAGAGDIRMTQSEIKTGQGGDIQTILAGNFNVGISVFSDAKASTGINTVRGGDIAIFAGQDVNVNESRVMTWFGGDIIIWADHGNINAGKGSKTQVSVSEAEKTIDEATGSYVLEYTLPAVGSGIRLLTYDPDGAAGPGLAPKAGDGYFFAPDGEIDAGEAGIEGQGNILLNAPVLVNTQNISVGGLSAGASISQDAGSGITSLSGSGSMADNAGHATEEAAMASAKERFSDYVAELSDSLVPKWLAVEVVGFGDVDEEYEKEEDSQ